MEFTLTNGTIQASDNLDGWTITSESATVKGAEDIKLMRGDQISANGDVFRNGENIANIA